MTDTKDLTEKQKFFEKRYERSGEYLSGVAHRFYGEENDKYNEWYINKINNQ